MDKRTAKPIRSYLWAGITEKSAAAAAASGADAIAFDLEEPVTPYTEKDRAHYREFVGNKVRSLPSTPERPHCFVRVNPPWSGRTTPDLAAVMSPRLSGVMQPKVMSARDIHAMDALLTDAEAEHGVDAGSICIYPILETAEGIRNAYEIATASDRVAYMGGAMSRFGDIWQGIQFTLTEAGLESLYLRSKVLYEARAAGIKYPLAGGFGGAPDDADALRNWLIQLRQMGYYGTQMNRPDFVPMVNAAFSPTTDDIAYWQEMVTLTAEAEQAGSGPVRMAVPPESPRESAPLLGAGAVVHIAHVGSANLALNWARDLELID